jgi:pentatricopeptide repeat protein
MQSSMSKQLQRVVSLKLRSNNRPASNYFLQLQHDYFAASQSRDYDGNTSNKPYSNVNVNVTRNNIDITRERRRMHSTSTSTTSTTLVASNNKSFWRDLHQAVQQGNGSHAEEIVDQVLKDYYRSNNLSSSAASSTPTTIVDKNNDHQHFHSNVNISSSSSSSSSINNNKSNNNSNNKHNITPPQLDSKIFGLTLQAWKNSEYVSLDSALRAHNVLVQMAALADQDILCEPPVLKDYLAVLECWYQATCSSLDEKSSSSSHYNKNINIDLVLQYSEELWDQMKERQRRDTMTSTSTNSNTNSDTNTDKSIRFVLDENAYEIYLSLLARAGRAAQAEEVLNEAVVQNCMQENNNSSLCSAISVSDVDIDSEENNHDEKYQPCVSLQLCRTVLEAHSRSKETKASERAETFLQKMRTDSSLPNPDVRSYNLVLQSLVNTFRRQNGEFISDKVEELIRQMKEDRVQPNLMSYQYGIDCLSRLGEAVRAETLLASLVKDYFLQYDADLKPNIEPFQSVLRAYLKANHRLHDAAERAESILKNMKELSTYLDSYPTVWSYNVVMKCWARSKSKNSASRTMALYEELRHSSSLSFPAGTNNDGGTYSRHADLKPDAASMNTTINVFSINESADRTELKLREFYERHMQEPQANLCPDTIAFTTVIKAWSKSSDPSAPDRAENLLRKLNELYNDGKNKKFKPDVMTYTNVMQCWIKSRKREAPEKAERILRQLQSMERDGDVTMAPDTAAWNSAISGWASAGNGERAEALFLEMLDAHRVNPDTVASPNSITFTNVLNAWAKTRSPDASDRAISLLEKMEKFYSDGILAVKPNVVNYSVVLDCLAYAKQTPAAVRAESMLRQMAASDDPNLHPTVVSYNSVIKAWSYTRDDTKKSVVKITSLLREIIGQSESNPKMRPNSTTFGQVLKFLNESDLPDKAKRAKAIENIMKIFLNHEPKEWVKKELQKCLSSSSKNTQDA